MANRIYNVKVVEAQTASVGNASTTVFAYKGFNSRSLDTKFKQYDIELIKQDLLNHFNIRRGEKLENPEFGTMIWSMLFEPMTDENIKIIAKDVEQIVNRDPRTQASNLTVDSTEFGVRVEVDLTYFPFDYTERMAIDFDKQNLPT
jgi:phage baseplate assembly protein W